jgi:hypothetical protein
MYIMKKAYLHFTAILVTAFLFSTVLSAQQATVNIRVEKDGKLVKDTTSRFDDAEMAEHAVKVMEIMSENEEHIMKYKSGDEKDMEVRVGEEGDCGHKKKIRVMVSEDEGDEWKVIEQEVEESGEEVEITKIIESGEGEEVKVIVVKKKAEKEKSKKQ